MIRKLMPIQQTLANFQACIADCGDLIASAHNQTAQGAFTFSAKNREQITMAAFLNLFIGWEEFLEASFNDFLMGEATLSGRLPVRYVSPPTREHSAAMIVHVGKYFEFSNHESVKKAASLFFKDGNPYHTTISMITQELSEIKIIRNSCAHTSKTTRSNFENLALRLLGNQVPNLTPYILLTAQHPRSTPRTTVYEYYKNTLLASAHLIATG